MPKNRRDMILDIIKENGFVTVKYLCENLHYSTATINRDLNYLKNQNLIVRKCGGAELPKSKYVPLVFRSEKMKNVKNILAKEAATLITDSMTVFIDASTTTQYLGKYLTKFKNLTVITNNLNLAIYLSNEGLTVIVLGGTIIERPYAVWGFEAAQQAATYNADIMFFSTASITSDGRIGGNPNTIMAMMKNSKRIIYLADRSKIDYGSSRNLCDLSGVSAVISDYKFSDETKKAYPETQFIEVSCEE